MGGAASKTKQTKKEAGGPMRGVVPGAGQDEAAVGDGAAAGGGAAWPRRRRAAASQEPQPWRGRCL